MPEKPFNPGKIYWDELRSIEQEIFERSKELTPQMYPEYKAAEVWSSGMVDPIGADSIAYNATQRIVRQYRRVRLAMFNFDDAGDEGQARVYEIRLKPNREKMISYPVFAPLCKQGPKGISQQRFAAGRLAQGVPAAMMPNGRDYSFVYQQLERGASGVFTRWSPRHKSSEEQC